MRIAFHTTLPKRDEPDDTCEDTIAIGEPDERFLRVAVADGASDGLFAREWATLLAERYAAGEFVEAEVSPFALDSLRVKWQRMATANPLPWYMQAKLGRGAGAALVGVTLDRAEGRWQAVGVGDCCLFQVRDAALEFAFPVCHSADFDSVPVLLHTDPARSGETYLRRAAGTFTPSDTFYLMSDALAAWFLTENEAGREPWNWLKGVESRQQLANRVRTLRDAGRLRNDDVAVAVVSGQ